MNTDLPPEFEPPPLSAAQSRNLRASKRKSSRQSILAAVVLLPIVSFAIIGVPERQKVERARTETTAYAANVGGRSSRVISELQVFAEDYASVEAFEDEDVLRTALDRGKNLEQRCSVLIQELQSGAQLRRRLTDNRLNFDEVETVASEFQTAQGTRDMLSILTGSLRVLRSTAKHRSMLLELHGRWEAGDNNDVWFESRVTKSQINEFNRLAETVRADARRLQGLAQSVQRRAGR